MNKSLENLINKVIEKIYFNLKGERPNEDRPLQSGFYWNEEGKYQKAYESIYDVLVPHEGQAKTKEGEVLRIISKAYYRFYNDGDKIPFEVRESVQRFLKDSYCFIAK